MIVLEYDRVRIKRAGLWRCNRLVQYGAATENLHVQLQVCSTRYTEDAGIEIQSVDLTDRSGEALRQSGALGIIADVERSGVSAGRSAFINFVDASGATDRPAVNVIA